jgi:hypothetical protein
LPYHPLCLYTYYAFSVHSLEDLQF